MTTDPCVRIMDSVLRPLRGCAVGGQAPVG